VNGNAQMKRKETSKKNEAPKKRSARKRTCNNRKSYLISIEETNTQGIEEDELESVSNKGDRMRK
jgi:hypothetical protein